MAENGTLERFVGPVMKAGEIGEAVIEAIQENNEGRKIEIEEHESYYRVKVEGECLISLATVSEVLGREVQVSDIEQNMPSFEGFIRVAITRCQTLRCSFKVINSRMRVLLCCIRGCLWIVSRGPFLYRPC